MSEKLEIHSLFSEKSKRNKYILRLFLVFAIFLFLIFTFSAFRKITVLMLFITANYVFAFLKRKVPFSFVRKYLFGLEIIMICTVATSIAMGPKTGAVMGGLLMIVNYLAEGRSSEYFIVTILLYTIAGYAAYYYRSYDFIALGVLITSIYNFFAFIFSKLMGANTVTLLVFSAVNIASNILLFTIYGNFVLGLLS